MSIDVNKAERLLIELSQLLGTKLVVDPTVTGNRWTSKCIDHFVSACGVSSVVDVSSRQLPYDLLVCEKKVQCKKRNTKRTGQCCITKSRQIYTIENVDFFAICYGQDAYVIPSVSLMKPDGTIPTEFFVCDYWKYKNAWGLPKTGHVSLSSLPLFSQGATDGTQAR
jgi:hypothetical protein